VANRLIGAHGADWIGAHVLRRPLRVLTHCNTGSLATAAYGTALGIIRELHHRGVLEMVYVDETRPLLQGSRLTAWELATDGIAHRVQPDAAAASTVLQGLVDVAVVGADRIAANGDTANKIGTPPSRWPAPTPTSPSWSQHRRPPSTSPLPPARRSPSRCAPTLSC
jgi:methylthioribose-1-phosphate isomerase